jgi:hypothetical protein
MEEGKVKKFEYKWVEHTNSVKIFAKVVSMTSEFYCSSYKLRRKF